MKGYGKERRQRCCPGHDSDSKIFDRAHRHRRLNTQSRKNYLRILKKVGRKQARAEIKEQLAAIELTYTESQ